MAKDSSSNNQDTKTQTTSNGGDNSEAKATVPANQCPDCEGRGIRNPELDRQVCATCEGRGTIA